MENKVINSEDVFDKICDLLNIPESEREMVSLDVHLEVGEAVSYTAKKYAKGGE